MANSLHELYNVKIVITDSFFHYLMLFHQRYRPNTPRWSSVFWMIYFDCPYRKMHLKSYTRTTNIPVQARSQPARWGGSELGWVEHQAHPPLGHCPRDVINLKNAPTLGHSQAPPPLGIVRVTSSIWKTPPLFDIHKHPPPLDIARVTSSTYSKGGTKLLKGGTKLLKGGTKLLKGGTKLLKGGTKLLKGGTKLLKGGTKLLKGGTKSLGWATGGGRTTPPTPPWLRACSYKAFLIILNT